MYTVTKRSLEILLKYNCFRIEDNLTEVGRRESVLRVTIKNLYCQKELINRWMEEMDEASLIRANKTLEEIDEQIEEAELAYRNLNLGGL